MELFERIITERISSVGQLDAAAQARVAADPQLATLIEQNAELLGVAGQSPQAPDMAAMLRRVRVAEGILREPQPFNPLQLLLGKGWQLKSLGSLAAVAVLIAALVAIPGLLANNPLHPSQPDPARLALEAEQAAAQAMLAASSSGTWLEYALDTELSERERSLLGQKLELAVSENSAALAHKPQVSLLADGKSYAVYVPQLASSDSRIDEIDNSIRRVDRFSLQHRGNRLYVQNSAGAADFRIIRHGDDEIAFPAGLAGSELISTLQAVVPQLPDSGLPADPRALSAIVSEGYASALPGSGMQLAVEDGPANGSQTQPGISAEDDMSIRNFENFELRLGKRLENSLANYELTDEQIEVYRHDLEQEMTMHLLLPSNWNQLDRRDLDDYVYTEMLRRFRALGIEADDIERERIAVYVNDDDADSEVLPSSVSRLMVEIR